jgi:sirohydrochlorin cobaltochelatase
VKAVILLAHGSRDPLWRRPLEAVAARLQATHPQLPVCSAYLELEPPDLASAAEQLANRGAREIAIVPMFLGTGKHAREDLPRLVDGLQKRHPQLRISLRQPVGEDSRVVELLAAIAAE